MSQNAGGCADTPKIMDRLLRQIEQAASSDDPLLDKLGDVEAAVSRAAGMKNCSIWLAEKDEAWMARNMDSFRVRRNTGPLGKFLANHDDFFFTDDYLHDPRIDPFSPEAVNLRMCLSRSTTYTPGDAVPQAYVRIRSNDATLGVMVITRKGGERWTDADKKWLSAAAARLAPLIEKESGGAHS